MTPENYKFHTEQLKRIQREETEIGNTSCRYAVNTIIATVLGLLVKNSIQTYGTLDHRIFKPLILFAILLIAIVFYCIESWKRYTYANNARKLYNKLTIGKVTDDTIIIDQMIKLSNKSLTTFKYQLYICSLMTILLLIYFIVDFI